MVGAPYVGWLVASPPRCEKLPPERGGGRNVGSPELPALREMEHQHPLAWWLISTTNIETPLTSKARALWGSTPGSRVAAVSDLRRKQRGRVRAGCQGGPGRFEAPQGAGPTCGPACAYLGGAPAPRSPGGAWRAQMGRGPGAAKSPYPRGLPQVTYQAPVLTWCPDRPAIELVDGVGRGVLPPWTAGSNPGRQMPHRLRAPGRRSPHREEGD